MSRLPKIPAILEINTFSKQFNIAVNSKLTKEEYMSNEMDLKEIWDEYAIKKTIEYDLQQAREEGRKEGLEEMRQKRIRKGIKEVKSEVIRNFLSANKFSIAEIANFIKVPEAFVRKVKKEIK